MPFVPRSDHELHSSTPEELLRYVADAKRAGELEHATTGIHMLLFRSEERMRRRVALRLPPHLRRHTDTVAAWVLERIARSALKLGMEGESVGQWVNWWGSAIDRQVVSFWRSAQGRTLEREAALASEHQDDGAPPDRVGAEFDADSVLFRAACADAVSRALAQLDNPAHVAILKRAIWDDQPSKLVAEEFGTTAMNVDQIKSRFKRLVRDEWHGRGMAEA